MSIRQQSTPGRRSKSGETLSHVAALHRTSPNPATASRPDTGITGIAKGMSRDRDISSYSQAETIVTYIEGVIVRHQPSGLSCIRLIRSFFDHSVSFWPQTGPHRDAAPTVLAHFHHPVASRLRWVDHCAQSPDDGPPPQRHLEQRFRRWRRPARGGLPAGRRFLIGRGRRCRHRIAGHVVGLGPLHHPASGTRQRLSRATRPR